MEWRRGPSRVGVALELRMNTMRPEEEWADYEFVAELTVALNARRCLRENMKRVVDKLQGLDRLMENVTS